MNVTALGDLAVFGVRREEKGSLADIRTEIVQMCLKLELNSKKTHCTSLPGRVGLLEWLREGKAQGHDRIDHLKHFKCCLK